MKTKTQKDTVWTRPGKITHAEFVTGIRDAEKGPFMTIEELRKQLDDWKREKGYL